MKENISKVANDESSHPPATPESAASEGGQVLILPVAACGGEGLMNVATRGGEVNVHGGRPGGECHQLGRIAAERSRGYDGEVRIAQFELL